MDSALCSFASSSAASIRLPLPLCPSPRRRPVPLHVRAAITRTKKEETVALVREQLENCHLLAGIHYEGMTVKQFKDLRRCLPDSVRILVAKNTLVGKAIEGTTWAPLSPCLKGMNAWMFVHTEEILDALKPFREFQKESKLEETNDFVGAVFEGKFFKPEEFNDLESLPSKPEVFSKLLGSLQGPSAALVGTLQAPARDVVLCLKAYVKKLEEQEGK